MITASAPSDDVGTAVLADVAGSAVGRLGGSGEVAALAVRLLADDARRRTSIDGDTAELSLAVVPDGTELAVTVTDTAEPVGGPAAEVLALVELGLATAADGGADGTGNRITVRLALPTHTRLFDDAGVEVLGDDAPRTDVPVTVRTLTVDDAGALTRCLYRCYGWTYPGVDLYYPDRIAAAIESGRRIGEVAVTDDGEVAAHWGAVFVADGVVETGGTITDPRFRGRGLANQLGERLLARLVDAGVHGRMREPVVTHSATQHIAMREGAAMVGVHLHVAAPLRQVGITDGMLDDRVSVTVMYGPLAPLEPATLWVPAVYEPIVRAVVEPTGWPRQIGAARAVADCPDQSVMVSSYDALNRTGVVQVTTVGADLIAAVDEALGQLRSAGAEMVMVQLPANQPALAVVGAGLGALCLGYASLLPAFGDMGDALVLQWLADPTVDTSTWEFANEHVHHVVDLVVTQARSLGDQAVRDRRRAALRQQLFAALPVED